PLSVERRVDVSVVRVDEIEPLTEASIATLETVESGLLARVDFHHLLETSGRQVGLEELLLLDVSDFHEHFDALTFRRHDVELQLKHTREIRPLLSGLIDAFQAAQRE